MRILRTDSHFRPTAKSGRATASKLLRQTKNKDGIKYTIFVNIIGNNFPPHSKSFTGAQKLRGLKLGLKHDHFQQFKLSNNHLNTRIVNNKSHFQ